MSGDVQPRKRKDKRKKKDASSSERSKAEAEYIARKLSLGDESDEGIGPTKSTHSPSHGSLASDGDSVIHVHHEGGTGGHWCAKIVFFMLLGVLVFLIGLIIIENRGLTDLDTPVGESRYAQVFDGWVDEGPVHDDHHDEHTLELNHAEDSHEEDLDDEHDEEIEDIEDEHGDSEDEHSDDDDTANSDDEDDHHETEDEEDDNASDEGLNNDSDEQENEIDNDEDQDDDHDEDQDDDHDEDQEDDDEDDEYLDGSHENNYEDTKEDNISAGDEEEDENDSKLEESSENMDLPFEEVDSMEEEVVENSAGEEEHLAAKQAEQLAHEQEESGIGMRVGIGLVLLMVAYCVLARKWHNDSDDGTPEIVDVKRRMTLISDEDIIDDAEKEIEEKIIKIKETLPVLQSKPQPSFFAKPAKQIVHRYEEDDDDVVISATEQKKPTMLIHNTKLEDPEELEVEEEYEEEEEQDEEEDDEPLEKISKEEIANIDSAYKEDKNEDVNPENVEELDDEEILDEEILEEDIIEEEEEEEDISEDLDDTDLMKKLEAKYGKLPQLDDDQPEGHSDEDVSATPTRKRGKPSGGNAVDDLEPEEWVDDSNDHWKLQLDLAQAEMDEGLFD